MNTSSVGGVLGVALSVVLALAAYDLSQPPQVASITYTLDGATLHFKRPTLHNLSGRFDLAQQRLAASVWVPQAQLAEAVVERNRGQAFVCGAQPCSFSNPVWAQYQEAQTLHAAA